jgi:hypothetical protein
MTPKAQRIAIAEACGWRIEPSMIQRGYNLITPDGKLWDSFWDNEAKIPVVGDRWMNLPDYLIDLNAMHEAEKVLTRDQCFYYRDEIQKAVLKTSAHCSADFVFGATAAQRAEAFLRTLNLWKEE